MNKRYRVAVSFVFEIESANDTEAIRHTTIHALPYGEESSSKLRHLQMKVISAMPLEKVETPVTPQASEKETQDEAAS